MRYVTLIFITLGFFSQQLLAAPLSAEVLGRWDLEYDWTCSSNPRHAILELFADNRYIMSEDEFEDAVGHWQFKGAEEIVLQFDSPFDFTKYYGSIQKNRLEWGYMISEGSPHRGCWNATKMRKAKS